MYSYFSDILNWYTFVHFTDTLYISYVKWNWSRSVMSDSLRPHRLSPTRFLRPWDFPGKNTGVGFHSLLQGIFPTKRSNPCSCISCIGRWTLHLYRHLGSPWFSVSWLKTVSWDQNFPPCLFGFFLDQQLPGACSSCGEWQECKRRSQSMAASIKLCFSHI